MLSWLKSSYWKAIQVDIVKVIYQREIGIITGNFKTLMQAFYAISDDLLKWIYDIKDEHEQDSYFDHQIRNSRGNLLKMGYLIKRDGKHIATQKLIKLDLSKAMLRTSDFWKEAQRKFDNQKLQNQHLLDNDIEFIIKTYKPEKKTSNEGINSEPIVQKLRKIFKVKIEDEKKNLNIKNTYTDSNFLLPDSAHILPVHFLYKKNRWEDIANSNNGLLLDPNTHKLFDHKCIKFDKHYNFVWTKTNEIYSGLKQEILNSERKKYIEEYMKCFEEITINKSRDN